MVNKMEKGRRSMRKARKIAESLGYLVFQIHHTRWQKDVFGLWDQIWVNKEGEVIWVQVKTNRVPSKKELTRYHLWCQEYKQKGLIVVIRDRKKPLFVTIWERN